MISVDKYPLLCRRSIVLILLIWISGPPAEAQFSRLDQARTEDIDDIVQSNMQSAGIVGCSVGLMRGGEIALLKGYGFRDRTNGTPATEHTIYRTGSVAKTFTAILAMQLVEQEKLELMEDVRVWVPEYPEKPEGMITPYRLLCHRSGIRHYEEYDTAAAVYYERDHYTYDPITALDVFKNGTLLFEPGTDFSYTTFGYNLLGAVIERAGKQTFEQQLHERINTVLDLPYVQAEYQRLRPYPEETKGYHRAGSLIVDTPEDIGILFKVPGGGLLCTAVDLTLLMQGLAEYRLFDETEVQEWMSIDHSGGNNFGLGIITGTHRGRPYLWHAGGQQRTSTIWLYDPATLDGVVITSNTFGTATRTFALALLDAIAETELDGPTYTHIPHTLEAPQLLSPENDAEVQHGSIELRWATVPHAFTYICEHATDSLFSNSIRDTTYTTSVMLDNPQPGVRMYWRVHARNEFLYSGSTGPYSETSRFRTRTLSSISDETPKLPLSIYPNPAAGAVNIAAPDGRRITSVELHALSGRLLLRRVVHQRTHTTLSLTGLRDRLLLLSIHTDDGATTRRTIMQR